MHIWSKQEFFHSSNFPIASNERGPRCRKVAGPTLGAPNRNFRKPVPRCHQAAREVACRTVALLGFLIQAALDHPTKRRGNFRIQRRNRFQFIPQNGRERLCRAGPLEGRSARQHLVQY